MNFQNKIFSSIILNLKRELVFLFTAIIMLSGCSSTQSGHHTFTIEKGNFLYDNNPIHIYSGEMHYPRVPKTYWRHRFQMMKAMGLNTVSTYVFWNYHNTAPGVWDFKSENRNLVDFIRTAQEEGLFVILRPGPYICGEWEFGGFPWWLSNNKDLEVRGYNQPFLDSCQVYINKVAEQVRDLQISKEGPIIMVQVENEFGYYVSQRKDIPAEEHKKYLAAIKQMLVDNGFEVPLYISDGSKHFEGGTIEGTLPTANGEGDIENLKKIINQYNNNNKGPYMVAEFYPGWLDHWGEPFVRSATSKIVEQTEKYLRNEVSFNFYMVHGGTNFGFTSGANYNNEHDIQPDLTSYDYDAPISEAGWASTKYLALRELMKGYVDYQVPEIPEPNPVIIIPDIRLSKTVDFFEWKKSITPIVNETPLSFEELGQGNGYVLYCKQFVSPIQGELQLNGLRDYALVYVNGKKIGELNRVFNDYFMDINIPANGQLEILVENLGRFNYGSLINQNKKGIVSPVVINNVKVEGDWEMYKVPMDTVPTLEGMSNTAETGHPALYKGEFNLDQTGDTFLDMQAWGKGIVFVNGHNLGRYWNIGPQQTLYLPGCWLKKGKNEIFVFEQLNDQVFEVLKTKGEPVLEVLKNKN